MADGLIEAAEIEVEGDSVFGLGVGALILQQSADCDVEAGAPRATGIPPRLWRERFHPLVKQRPAEFIKAMGRSISLFLGSRTTNEMVQSCLASEIRGTSEVRSIISQILFGIQKDIS